MKYIILIIILFSSTVLKAEKYSELKLSYLHQLATKGDVNAQYWLGSAYYGYVHNEKYTPNAKKALKWLKKASEQGNSNSDVLISTMYLVGKGVKKSHSNASKWLKKASEKGNKSASYNLSVMYEDGWQGQKPNKSLAGKYFKLSQSQKHIEPFDPEVKSLPTNNKSIVKMNSKGHSHAGRTHDHPLPKQGVKHRHGNGAYGTSLSNKIVANKNNSSKHPKKTQISKPKPTKNISIPRVVSNSISGNLDGWHAVTDWKKFRKLLSGNTLILIPTNCPSSTSQSDCKVIWLLDKVGSGMRDDAQEINLISKSVTKTEWGTCAGFDYYLCIGSLKAKIITLPKKLSKYVFVNPVKKQFKVINKNGKNYIFNIVKGHPRQFVQLASSNNFKKYTANSTGLIQSLLLKAGEGMVKAMKESASYSSSSSNSSFCGVSDTCYKYIKSKKSGAAVVRCTKGSYTGQEKCLSYKKSNGKYASGCGMSDIFAHHYTLEKAGNIACGQ